MITLSRRKLLLISSIFVLTIVYVLQLTLGGDGAVRVVTLDATVDAIEILNEATGPISLVNDGGQWYVSEDRIRADNNTVGAMLSAISSVKTLGRVSGNPESGAFGLDTPITVSAFSSGKKVRTIIVGNTSATMMQTYCQLDSSNDVLLVSGNLRATFDKSEESLFAAEETTTEDLEMGENNPLGQLGLD
ncbi:MAG TPA: DUF4340 domain-containing protein [Treponema sp.]|nr:DUF4340 domain-containing protein [Treponema sp.]